jgi:hypothetical protein
LRARGPNPSPGEQSLWVQVFAPNGRIRMPRKPNYRFERMERQRAKTAKKAERAKVKAEKSDQKKEEDGPEEPAGEPVDS